MEHFPKSTPDNNGTELTDTTSSQHETVYAADGTAYSADEVRAAYGPVEQTKTYGNPYNYDDTPVHDVSDHEDKTNDSIVPFVSAVGGAAAIAYKTYEPFHNVVNETAEAALDVTQQAFEIAGDRPLLFAGVTALGIGSVMVHVWREVRKHKNKVDTDPTIYGNSRLAPDGTWKLIE